MFPFFFFFKEKKRTTTKALLFQCTNIRSCLAIKGREQKERKERTLLRQTSASKCTKKSKPKLPIYPSLFTLWEGPKITEELAVTIARGNLAKVASIFQSLLSSEVFLFHRRNRPPRLRFLDGLSCWSRSSSTAIQESTGWTPKLQYL